MPEEAEPGQPQKRGGRTIERRPTWTMDVMILSNLNEIAKFVDENATKAESGDFNAMIEWKAGLRQFYRNMQSFLTEQGMKLCDDAFAYLDTSIDSINRVLPGTSDDLAQSFKYLDFLNRLLYTARNDLFMKVVTIMSGTEKSVRYNLAALPGAQLDAKVEETLQKEDDAKARREAGDRGVRA